MAPAPAQAAPRTKALGLMTAIAAENTEVEENCGCAVGVEKGNGRDAVETVLQDPKTPQAPREHNGRIDEGGGVCKVRSIPVYDFGKLLQSFSQSIAAMLAADKTRGSTAKVSTVTDAAPMRRYQASKPDDTASLISWVITHLTHWTTNIRPSPSARP
ncbi:hypothetical protein CSIM01_01437 [Colletotrichum simmondsii]|uniref:Uncharacterized protein n=1 Tax=Colletotrichum simmondsii TaxID=703756 RepID=A0A135S4I7_9PEZI|nr:hypothetical protein CSIM01_01437 [Colletotrichum simmondsii]